MPKEALLLRKMHFLLLDLLVEEAQEQVKWYQCPLLLVPDTYDDRLHTYYEPEDLLVLIATVSEPMLHAETWKKY